MTKPETQQLPSEAIADAFDEIMTDFNNLGHPMNAMLIILENVDGGGRAAQRYHGCACEQCLNALAYAFRDLLNRASVEHAQRQGNRPDAVAAAGHVH